MKKTFRLQLVHEKVDFELYKNHSTYNNGNTGLDLFILDDLTISPNESILVDLGVKCQLRSLSLCPWKWLINKRYNYHSYFLFPSSNISKTPLIIKSSIGLIDKYYSDSLKIHLMNISSEPFTIKRGENYIQLVNYDLSDINVKLVKSHDKQRIRSTIPEYFGPPEFY